MSGSTEFEDAILRLPDEEVQRIAASTEEEYRPEAIAFAQSVLRSRGLEFQPPAPAPVERRENAKKRVLLRSLLLAMAAVVALAGLQYVIRSSLSTPTYDPKLGAILLSLILWSGWGFLTLLIRRDPSPSIKLEVNWWCALLTAVLSTFLVLAECGRARP